MLQPSFCIYVMLERFLLAFLVCCVCVDSFIVTEERSVESRQGFSAMVHMSGSSSMRTAFVCPLSLIDRNRGEKSSYIRGEFSFGSSNSHPPSGSVEVAIMPKEEYNYVGYVIGSVREYCCTENGFKAFHCN